VACPSSEIPKHNLPQAEPNAKTLTNQSRIMAVFYCAQIGGY
jgi:hypothetical protein